MRAYRDNDMLVITNDAEYIGRFPFPAIGGLELCHSEGHSQVALHLGGPKPYTITATRNDAYALTEQINECMARWLADHFPNIVRD